VRERENGTIKPTKNLKKEGGRGRVAKKEYCRGVSWIEVYYMQVVNIMKPACTITLC
jgi:hypothetical protein